MDENLASSDIREILAGEYESSDEESDIPGEEVPEDISLQDLGLSSDEENEDRPNPNEDEIDSESSLSESDTPLVQRLPRPRNWVRVLPPEPERNIENEFNVRHTGIKGCPPRNSSPISYFYLFFTLDIWNLLTNETNFYAAKTIRDKRSTGDMRRFSRLKDWVHLQIKDLKTFISLILNMGVVREKNYVDYWSTKSNRYHPFFPNNMSLRKFQLISSMFHISRSQNIPRNHNNFDPWNKIRSFYDYINSKFKEHFVPGQNLAIDESLIAMKNRCVYIMYMPNKKHARYGIKKFEMCESESNYVLNVALYSGKDFLSQEPGPFTEKVVIDQLNSCNLLNKGHHVFTDNYYTKIPLARKLLEKKTFLTGTINKNSKELPKNILTANLGVEKSIYYRQDDILLVKYKQKKSRKPVHLLTTGCHAEDKLTTSRSGLQAVKPVVINKYNLKMGGVDSSDKSVYHLSCARQSKKYWKKIFYNLLDISVFNAYILYTKNTDKPMARDDFIDCIIQDLVCKESNADPVVAGPSQSQNKQHAIVHLEGKRERVCVICAQDPNVKRKKSVYWCPGCNCGIHPLCYHKLNHFYRPFTTGRKRKGSSSDSD